MLNLKNILLNTRFSKLLCIMVLVLSSQIINAQPVPNSSPADQRGSDKVDIKQLEQKYWAAKDDDFTVVQNRRYTKANRFYLTGQGGIPFNDPYTTGTLLSVDTGYFFSERWGVELSFNSGTLKDNDAVKQFVNQYGAIPDHNVFQSSYFVSGILVPFYAKMSFMEKSIIYFDMGLSLGLGMNNYNVTQKEGDLSKSAFAIKLGVFQQIFFSEHFAFRVDLNNTWSTQDQAKYYRPGDIVVGNTVAGTRDLGAATINDTSLLVGFTYWH